MLIQSVLPCVRGIELVEQFDRIPTRDPELSFPLRFRDRPSSAVGGETIGFSREFHGFDEYLYEVKWDGGLREMS